MEVENLNNGFFQISQGTTLLAATLAPWVQRVREMEDRFSVIEGTIEDKCKEVVERVVQERWRRMEYVMAERWRSKEAAMEEWCKNMEEKWRCKEVEMEERWRSKEALMEGRWRRTEQRLRETERKLQEASGDCPVTSPEPMETAGQLEDRVTSLEASVQRALDSFFPRVEALLSRQEGRPAQESLKSLPWTSSTSSSSPPSCTTAQQPSRAAHLGESLRKAANEGRQRDVNSLLDAGADVNARTGIGSTALHFAARKGYADILSLLLRRGADVHARDSNGHTALHLAAIKTGLCVRRLVEAGADVESANERGWTPLHVAALWNNEQTVRALLAAGASATTRNDAGQTPMEVASSGNARQLGFDPSAVS